MTARELIDSGLLEAYVIGQTDAQDTALVERMRATDPAVREELERIEEGLEQFAKKGAVAPPSAARAKVMERIAAAGPARAPIVRELPAARAASGSWRWLAAASVVALLLSATGNFMLLRELRHTRTELARLETEHEVLAQDLQVQRASYQHSQDQLAVVMDPRTDLVALSGTANATGAKARVYWDHSANRVFLDVLNLPEPPQGKQYQLWALVDGNPVDAGVFDMSADANGLQRMKDIPRAQAFAVTLEKAGGSPTPDLGALVLMGQAG